MGSSELSGPQLIVLAGGIWLTGVLLGQLVIAPYLRKGPGQDPATGLIWHVSRGFCRLMHRVRHTGQEDVRRSLDPGPLIIVSNHTGAVDPLLIQAGCHFLIRWLMAADMMTPALDWLWRRQRLIPVERNGQDTAPLREAIRHVKSGGAIGIFPEGRIVTPPRQIWPFMRGVGVLVTRTKAPVLLVWVSGTPETTSLAGSVATPSNARVQFVDLIDFSDVTDASRIAETLRQRLARASGWPLSENVPPLENGRADPFGV